MGSLIGANPSIRYAASQGQKFNADTTLEVVHCPTCGITYAIPESLVGSAQRWHGDRPNGWSISCPLGHTWHYCGETKLEKARRERNEARDRLAREQARHDQTTASLRATKGVVTKQRKKLARVTAGVCPCCNRTFQNVARHMKTKHPELIG